MLFYEKFCTPRKTVSATSRANKIDEDRPALGCSEVSNLNSQSLRSPIIIEGEEDTDDTSTCKSPTVTEVIEKPSKKLKQNDNMKHVHISTRNDTKWVLL
ncbi:hypothetical protein QE152_g25566 [Popillia japonica]|uniref:Uncharacterized protein n=1 Tax=Popillia japonica TaxID=7064 RepID=A0AAW1K132_POPJA